MALIQHDLPWLHQPQEVTALRDWVPRGSLVYVPGRPLMGDAPGAEFGTPVAVDASPYLGGIGLDGSGTTSRLPIGALKMARADLATVWVAQVVRATDSVRYVCGELNTGTAYLEEFAINMDDALATSAGRVFLRIRNAAASSNSRAGSTNAVVTSGRLHTVVWRYRGGASFELWVDGAQQAFTVGASGGVHTTDGAMEFPLALLNRNVRDAFSDGGAGLRVGLFARLLEGNTAPLAELSGDPWGTLFEPQRTIFYAAAGGGGGSALPVFAHHYRQQGMQ